MNITKLDPPETWYQTNGTRNPFPIEVIAYDSGAAYTANGRKCAIGHCHSTAEDAWARIESNARAAISTAQEALSKAIAESLAVPARKAEHLKSIEEAQRGEQTENAYNEACRKWSGPVVRIGNRAYRTDGPDGYYLTWFTMGGWKLWRGHVMEAVLLGGELSIDRIDINGVPVYVRRSAKLEHGPHVKRVRIITRDSAYSNKRFGMEYNVFEYGRFHEAMRPTQMRYRANSLEYGDEFNIFENECEPIA